MKLTLNKLCELVAMDRRAVAPLISGIAFEAGPNNSHLYESAEALAAIYRCRHKNSGPEATLAEAKIRNELAAAKLREISAKQKLEELVPAEISRIAINAFIKYVAVRFDELRRRGVIDREWINQCGERFNELLADLCVQHGLEFWKATLRPEDVQSLIDRGFPEVLAEAS
jgi:hypothetical protein